MATERAAAGKTSQSRKPHTLVTQAPQGG